MATQGLPIKGPIHRSSSISLGGSPAAGVLTTTPPAGWVDPAVANRAYAFCTFVTVDGRVPSGIEAFVAQVDTTSVVASERRIYLKATWTPPVTLDRGTGLLPMWTSVELLASATAAPGASVLPDHDAPDDVTGWRSYYILPIGVVRWSQIGGVWTLSVFSDDQGSFRSEMRGSQGVVVAASGPDLPPQLNYAVDVIFRRNSEA